MVNYQFMQATPSIPAYFAGMDGKQRHSFLAGSIVSVLFTGQALSQRALLHGERFFLRGEVVIDGGGGLAAFADSPDYQ